ncbi:MAG: O-antigen ligase family protein [Bryobacteraceae bacterium]
MNQTRLLPQRSAFYLAFASVVAILFSIAISNILLALAMAALLLSGEKLRFPPIKLPLLLFMGGTVISLLLSADPAAGRPQIRKFFVFLTLLVVYSTFRHVADVRKLVLVWGGVATASALRSFAQLGEKYQQAQELGRDFYTYYVPERTTGFMSHWMTFGGQQMLVLLLLTAFVFWAPARQRTKAIVLAAAGLIGLSILVGFTRSIWLATGLAGLYLIWRWRPRLLWGVPVLLIVAVVLAPSSIRTRATSIVQPKGEIDSNEFRIVCWRTGWEMIKAHPFFGLGPEHVKIHFREYVPPAIPEPLPIGWYGHLHNIYIHYAAERGIPTMLALMWLLGRILLDFWRAARRLPAGAGDARFILYGSIAVMIGVLVTGIFELNLGDSEVLILFLALVSCGYVAVDHARQAHLNKEAAGV